MDGRFTEILVSRFRSNKGVTEAVDTFTGDTVILKSFRLTEEEHYEAARQEAAVLQQLGMF